MYDLKIKAMSCGHCVQTITEAIKKIDPAAEVRADLAQKRVQVTSQCTLQKLGNVLAEAGYPATPAGNA